jgi:hypothetical protein
LIRCKNHWLTGISSWNQAFILLVLVCLPLQDNELFVGRAAMLGWAFGLLGEVITGRGFLSQLGYEVRA